MRAAAAALVLCMIPACAEVPGPPHVLLISVDTLRADRVPWAGDGSAPMPEVERLIARGTRFTHAVTPCPRTTQALASLMTGMYPRTTGVRTLLDTLSADITPLADIARNNGYETIAVVSNHILTRERQLDRGFDIYDFAGDERDARRTTEAAIGHLEQAGGGRPIFLWVHYIDPHVPYYPPERLAKIFDPGYRGRYALHFGDVKGGTGNRAYPADLPKQQAVFRNPLPDPVNRHIERLYSADARFTDEAIGTLLRWVRETHGDDWLIVFTADHGESLGEQDYYWDHGDYVYESTLRVPLAIVPPAGRRWSGPPEMSEQVSLVDVTPTVVDLLEWVPPGHPPRPFEGRSLLPLIQGASDHAPPVFAESGRSYFPRMIKRRVRFDVSGRFRAVIQNGWKLIWTPGQTGALEYELYDLKKDPFEKTDLYDPSHPQVPRLISRLRDWMVDDRDSRSPTLTPAQKDLLRSLGYIAD